MAGCEHVSEWIRRLRDPSERERFTVEVPSTYKKPFLTSNVYYNGYPIKVTMGMSNVYPPISLGDTYVFKYPKLGLRLPRSPVQSRFKAQHDMCRDFVRLLQDLVLEHISKSPTDYFGQTKSTGTPTATDVLKEKESEDVLELKLTPKKGYDIPMEDIPVDKFDLKCVDWDAENEVGVEFDIDDIGGHDLFEVELRGVYPVFNPKDRTFGIKLCVNKLIRLDRNKKRSLGADAVTDTAVKRYKQYMQAITQQQHEPAAADEATTQPV